MPVWFKRKIIYFPLLFLFLISFVLAVPPVRETTTFTGDTGISIQAPTMPYMRIGAAGELAIHLFNVTNGKLLTPNNTDIECSAALMWPNGSNLLIIKQATHHDDHYKLYFSENNITREGFYGFTIHCNNSHTGGYLTDYFRATTTGEEVTTTVDSEDELLLYFVFALSILLLAFAFWKQDQHLAAISGMLMFMLGLYIIINGFSAVSTTLSLTLGIVFICIGAYIFIRSSMENF